LSEGAIPVSFEQAGIKVEKEIEFRQLKDSLIRIFAAGKIEDFLKQLQKKGIRIRDFDLVLASGALEKVDDQLTGARKLYETLSPGDQGQIREFYLSKIEEVDSGLRTKYQKLYRYY
jgi:hypothetical protein